MTVGNAARRGIRVKVFCIDPLPFPGNVHAAEKNILISCNLPKNLKKLKDSLTSQNFDFVSLEKGN